ncbi:MAG: transcriptional regulator [Geobacteraceae bacterium]|nr:transcriptional regulator [Geobacteraceae bacterium]
MTTRPKKPFIPAEQHDTLRHQIIALLERETLSARDISGEVRITEKEVLVHLEHVRTATHGKGLHLIITPAVCRKCGFRFKKRERLNKPGKCPVCQGEQIEPPLFAIG